MTASIWIKICATTNLDDALASVAAGADALGFVFAESSRRVEPALVRSITSRVPAAVEKIGVFVDAAPESLREITETAGLSGIQLQGDEDTDYLRKLKSEIEKLAWPVCVIKTLQFSSSLAANLERYEKEDIIDRFLVDSGSAGKRGGTGKVFDWHAASRELNTTPSRRPIIIAGGLNPGNVQDAIGTLRPWGVDVVSGVERVPGTKDHTKIREFIKNVRSPLAEKAGDSR